MVRISRFAADSFRPAGSPGPPSSNHSGQVAGIHPVRGVSPETRLFHAAGTYLIPGFGTAPMLQPPGLEAFTGYRRYEAGTQTCSFVLQVHANKTEAVPCEGLRRNLVKIVRSLIQAPPRGSDSVRRLRVYLYAGCPCSLNWPDACQRNAYGSSLAYPRRAPVRIPGKAAPNKHDSRKYKTRSRSPLPLP